MASPPFPTTLKALLAHDTHPAVQFIKYGIAGGAATATHIVLFFLLGWFVFPCVAQSDPLVKLLDLTAPAVDAALRARYSVFCNIGAFLVSNAVAYVLNILFVFKPGKHHWLLEIGLFYAVSGVSLLVGTSLMGVLIQQFGLATSVAFGANIGSSLLINFAMRKFVIFKG